MIVGHWQGFFRIDWIDRSQRGYETRFGRNLTRLTNRFNVGVSWDINPEHWIKVEVENHGERWGGVRWVIMGRVEALLRREEKKHGTFRFLGYWDLEEDAMRSIVLNSLAA